MSLKTLKEINPTGNNNCERCKTLGEACGVCQNENITKEAIKHIKEENCPLKDTEKCNCFCGECGVINWIKHFFNIREEGLK